MTLSKEGMQRADRAYDALRDKAFKRPENDEAWPPDPHVILATALAWILRDPDRAAIFIAWCESEDWS